MVVVSVRDGDVWQGDTSLSPQGLPGLHNGDNHFVGKISRKATKPWEGFLAQARLFFSSGYFSLKIKFLQRSFRVSSTLWRMDVGETRGSMCHRAHGDVTPER